jgi:hypothetical protein
MQVSTYYHQKLNKGTPLNLSNTLFTSSNRQMTTIIRDRVGTYLPHIGNEKCVALEILRL